MYIMTTQYAGVREMFESIQSVTVIHFERDPITSKTVHEGFAEELFSIHDTRSVHNTRRIKCVVAAAAAVKSFSSPT